MLESEGEWEPTSPTALRHQIAAYDQLRARCPVAPSADGSWAVMGHADTVRILDDHHTFTSVVSSRVVVPNGMDPPEHTAYRAVVDRYFTPDAMAAIEPACREVARTAVAGLARGDEVDFMSAFADPVGVDLQCRFMGWPDHLHGPLVAWVDKNHAATRSRDREAMAEVALEFDDHIRRQLDERRTGGMGADDVTARLMTETIDGRPLTDEEIVSIVRNWTVGELATIAASFGIVAHHLARDPALASYLRGRPADIDVAAHEMLRINPPLIANRRRTTRAVTISGRDLPADVSVVVVWASANRDEAVMGDPDEFRLDRDPDLNLLYGRGIHYCPGEPLARLQLRIVVEELLAGTASLEMAAEPVVEAYPAGGFSKLPMRFT